VSAPWAHDAPHSRACGVRRHEHGADCHGNCPTCGGNQLASSPGWIMTTHGPVRRDRPPWDIPASAYGPDGFVGSPGTLEALDASIERIQGVLDSLRRVRASIASGRR
jgi:hypothetical protein